MEAQAPCPAAWVHIPALFFRAVWLWGNALTSRGLSVPTIRQGSHYSSWHPSPSIVGETQYTEYDKCLAHRKDVAGDGWLCYADSSTPISTEPGLRLKTGLGPQAGRFPRSRSGSWKWGRWGRRAGGASKESLSAYYLLCEEQRLRLKRQSARD